MVLPLFVLHLMHPNFWASLLGSVLFLLLFVLPPFFAVFFSYSLHMVLPLFVLHLMHLNFLASLLRAVLFLLLFVLPPLFSVFLSHISQMLFDAVFFLMFFDWHSHYSCLYIRLSKHPLF